MLFLLSDDLQFYKNLTYVVHILSIILVLLMYKDKKTNRSGSFLQKFFHIFFIFIHFYDILPLSLIY